MTSHVEICATDIVYDLEKTKNAAKESNEFYYLRQTFQKFIYAVQIITIYGINGKIASRHHNWRGGPGTKIRNHFQVPGVRLELSKAKV